MGLSLFPRCCPCAPVLCHSCLARREAHTCMRVHVHTYVCVCACFLLSYFVTRKPPSRHHSASHCPLKTSPFSPLPARPHLRGSECLSPPQEFILQESLAEQTGWNKFRAESRLARSAASRGEAGGFVGAQTLPVVLTAHPTRSLVTPQELGATLSSVVMISLFLFF